MRQRSHGLEHPHALRLALVLGAALLVGALLLFGPAPRAAAVGEPTVTGLSPNSGTTGGGNSVHIYGSGVCPGTTVTFGGTVAAPIGCIGGTDLEVLAPAHAAGAVYVIVTNANGPSTPSPASQYTYGAGGGGGGTLDFSQSNYSIAENGVSVTITVNRTGLTGGAVSVNYAATTGTASTFDFTPTAGTLNFNSGQTFASFLVFITDDFIAEANETINLALNTPTGGATLGLQSAATITIVDNETGLGGFLQFTGSADSIAESVGTVVVNVSRTGSTSGPVSVVCTTSNGTAIQPGDYSFTSTTLNWASGDGALKTCSVPIVNDATVEGDETFSLTLSSPGGGASLGSPSTAVLTIIDNDGPAGGVIFFSSPTYTVNENGISVTITVTRSGSSSGTASVNYATSSGTASPFSDYTTASGTLSWGAAENSSKTFPVFITDDALVEGDETVNLTLSGVVGAALGTQQTAVLTIVDNDAAIPSIFSVSPPSGSLTGGEIITITGANLAGATLVTFGGTSAPIISSNATTVTVFAPYRGIPGTVDVQVTTPFGTSAITSLSKYTYGTGVTVTGLSPTSGPTSGGTSVIITGTGFTGATAVYFGTTLATFTVNSSTTITATAPAHTAGTVDVTVITPLGTNPDTSADNYTYTAAAATHTYTLSFRWTIFVFLGVDGQDIVLALKGIESPTDNPLTNNIYAIVTAIFRWDAFNQVWLAFFPAGVGVPGANDITTFTKGVAYFIAVTTSTNWTILLP